jgi:hypothetical protein
MKAMKYLNQDQLLCELYELIQENGTVKVTNLRKAILGVENIYVQQQFAETTRGQIKNLKFGHMVGSCYSLNSDSEVKKMSQHFRKLAWSRHHQEQLEQKKKDQLREQQLLKFEPTINRKSQKIVSRAKSSYGGLTAREKNEINSVGTDNNYEDFLLTKVQLFKEKLAEKAKALETDRNFTQSNLLIPSLRSSNASRNRDSFMSSGNKRSKSA